MQILSPKQNKPELFYTINSLTQGSNAVCGRPSTAEAVPEANVSLWNKSLGDLSPTNE